MQSKISCFNRTLYRKDLTRFWPLWGGASFVGALFPLAMLMEMLQYGFDSYYESPVYLTRDYYEVLVNGVPGISLVYGALCALAVWSYLFNTRSVGMMHTLPVTRKGLFLTKFLSGMSMMLLPYVVTGGLCVIVTSLAGDFEPVGVAVTILGVLGESFFYFAAATLAAFITGNVFAMPALYAVFHFLAYFLEAMLTNLASAFFFGVPSGYVGVTEWLSPTIHLMSSVRCDRTYIDVPVPGRDWTDQKLVSVSLENGWIIGVYALVGLALLVLAWLLYSRRRSESAGDVVAVGWMKPVFRYGVALCAALGGGQVLYSLFWSGFQRGDQANGVVMTVCMAVAGLIGYYAASMLLTKSLRVFRGSLPGGVLVIAACAAICCVLTFDVFGVEDRMPAADDVTEVSFRISNVNSCGGTTQDPVLIDKLLAAHGAILAEKDQLRDTEYAYDYRKLDANGEYPYGSADFRVSYTLKNGRELTRDYYLNYVKTDADRAGSAVHTLAELVTDPGIQRVNLLPDFERLTGGYIDVFDKQAKETRGVELNADQARQVYDAVVRDVEAGNFGRTMFHVDTYAQETYGYHSIQLYYLAPEDAAEQNRTVRAEDSRTMGLDLSVYCTETLDALREIGVLTEDQVLYTDDHYEDAEKRRETYGDYASYNGPDGAYETAASVGVIGGADGPTEIVVG